MDNVIRNRQVNYKKKVTSETLETAEVGLASLKEAIERAQTIVDNLKDNPGWLALKKTYEEKLESIEDNLDNFKDMPDKHRDYLLADRKFSREFRDTVYTFERKIEHLQDQYEQGRATLEERKNRVRATEPSKL